MDTFAKGKVICLNQGQAVVKDVLNAVGKSIYRVRYNEMDRILVWNTQNEWTSSIYPNTLRLVQMNNIDESFIWPEDITNLDDDGFGYIVPIIPDGFVSYTDILSLKYRLDYRVLVIAAIQLSKAIESLSQNGLVKYGFLSFDVNVHDGSIIISGNGETIVPEGTRIAWFDNPRDTAPEVSLGSPLNCLSNRIILAKFIFQLLFFAHPFEGIRSLAPTTTNMQIKLYAEDPVFIFDRNDHRNKPYPNLQNNAILLWKETPTFVKEIFWRAFDKEAIEQPWRRPKERDFYDELNKYLAHLDK